MKNPFAALFMFAAIRLLAFQEPPPKILYDLSPRAVEYQLSRLSIAELERAERKPDDAKYRPVYVALLTRKGMSRERRDEALAVLVRMDRASATQVLLDALEKLPSDDPTTADRLAAMLAGQPAATLQGQRDLLTRKIVPASTPFVLRGAYAGLIVADNNPAIVNDAKDAALHAAAVAAVGLTRRDAAAFKLLAQEILAPPTGADASSRTAAIAALLLLPDSASSSSDVEPLARAMVTMVRDAPPQQRTTPAIVQAVQLGEKLAAALPDPSRVAIRRDLRALGVRVVRMETRVEQMIFDLNWFVAESGKPVQVVLFNPDAMPHNLVITRPGTAVAEFAAAAAALPMPTDPDVRPFVPNAPNVLNATKLLTEGETAQLSFTAPAQPGEYPFLCTFPGHWVRMYGVMLVVPNLDAWEANPTTPTDPVTKKPFASQRK